MGDRGYNAGGFAYMRWIACDRCGTKFPIGRHNARTSCSNKLKCDSRIEKRAGNGEATQGETR